MEQELIEKLLGVIEANTQAMKESAAANNKMANEVVGLRRTIQAAQHKIGGELGPIIDRGKQAADALAGEAQAAADSRRKPQ